LAELVIYENGDAQNRQVFELMTKRVIVGSSPDNQLVLADKVVASAHISLEWRYDHWVLQDLGSEQGTTINGQEVVAPHSLEHDDVIGIGNTQLTFQGDEIEETTSNSLITNQSEPSNGPWLIKVIAGTVVIIALVLILLLSMGFPLGF